MSFVICASRWGYKTEAQKCTIAYSGQQKGSWRIRTDSPYIYVVFTTDCYTIMEITKGIFRSWHRKHGCGITTQPKKILLGDMAFHIFKS